MKETCLSAPVDWWRTFFSGLVVESWLMAPTAEQTQREAEFIRNALDLSPPAQVLDVPCGGGRHSLALAGLGFDMTGVDISTDFLTTARRQTAPTIGSITWEEREMRDLPWPERFEGAYSFGNSFGYLDDEGNCAFLRAVAAALKPGARFALESGYVMEHLFPVLQERSSYPVGDIVMEAHRRYDPTESRLHVEYTLTRGSAIEKRSMSARIYSYRELVELLVKAGFTDVQGYGSLTREPFRLAAGPALMVASKPRS
jgi:SAM-dependent methyltransferase